MFINRLQKGSVKHIEQYREGSEGIFLQLREKHLRSHLILFL